MTDTKKTLPGPVSAVTLDPSAALIAQIVQRDHQAFSAFYDAVASRVFGCAGGYCSTAPRPKKWPRT